MAGKLLNHKLIRAQAGKVGAERPVKELKSVALRLVLKHNAFQYKNLWNPGVEDGSEDPEYVTPAGFCDEEQIPFVEHQSA